MNDFIYKFDIPFDKAKLIKESQAFDYETINTESIYRNRKSEEFDQRSFLKKNIKLIRWLNSQTSWSTSSTVKDDKIKLEESERIFKIFTDIFGTEDIEYYYLTQKQGTDVKQHVDAGVSCAINIIASGKETPIDFQDHGKETYKVALLNVTKAHGVPIQEEEDRVIFKIRFVNRSYEEVRDKLIEYFGKESD